jgi:hypothetical protein
VGKNPFADCEASFDPSKLPGELSVLPKTALVLVLRAVFDLALDTAHDHASAMEVTSEVLCRLVTTHRWNPAACDLREHALAMVDGVYRELRYGSRPEKEACAFYAQEQGNRTGSAEDMAVYAEEQTELERSDAGRQALAEMVRASVAGDELATRVCDVWEVRGDVTRAELVELLGASDADMRNALRLIRYQATKAKKALSRKGGVS